VEQHKVTIAIPFYNNKGSILDAVRSVFAQSYTDWVLLLVNDGSDDGSLEIVQKIKDERVQLLNDGSNKGLIYRLNQIIHITETKYLARMDADDIMHPLRIEKQFKYLEEHQYIDVLDTAIYTMDIDKNPIGIRRTEKMTVSYKNLLNNGIMTHSSIMGKTDWFKNNLYSEDFYRAEDQELWCRTFRYSVFDRLNEPLLIYREGNIEIRNYIDSIKSTMKIIRKYGDNFCSFFFIRFLLLRQIGKIITYWIFGLFHCQYILSSMRNRKLNKNERELVCRLIIDNAKTLIPGVERNGPFFYQ